MKLKYTTEKLQNEILVKYEDGSIINVSNTDLSEKELEQVIINSADYVKFENNLLELEKVRALRNKQFSKYDKYQLVLVWDSLNESQKQDYINWREAWLDATTTLVTPPRLSWFD